MDSSSSSSSSTAPGKSVWMRRSLVMGASSSSSSNNKKLLCAGEAEGVAYNYHKLFKRPQKVIIRVNHGDALDGGQQAAYNCVARGAMFSLLAVACLLVLYAEWEDGPSLDDVLSGDWSTFLPSAAGEPNIEPGCDYTKGVWIKSNKRAPYSGKECTRWLSPMWACRLHPNRSNFEYEGYHWQPNTCHLPSFNANHFLKRMRSKTIAFIGDSLGRQQFQSLMCLATRGRDMSRSVKDVGVEYGFSSSSPMKYGKTSSNKQLRPDGWAYRFLHTNTTILFYWSTTLTHLEHININESNDCMEATTMGLQDYVAFHLDQPDLFLTRNLHRFDVIILNTGAHWNPSKFQKNKWKFYIHGKSVHPLQHNGRLVLSHKDIQNAYNYSINKLLQWIMHQQLLALERKDEEHTKWPMVFYRTQSPHHFTKGDWDSGGHCDNPHLLNTSHPLSQSPKSMIHDYFAKNATFNTFIKLLDITSLSQYRDEAHISKYIVKLKTKSSQDCLHWCLPGVPDTWNQIIYVKLLQ